MINHDMRIQTAQNVKSSFNLKESKSKNLIQTKGKTNCLRNN